MSRPVLSEYGPGFLLWLMRKTSDFYNYLDAWAETLGVLDDLYAEADA